MAYSNLYPATYSPYYSQSYQQGSIIWVQGEAGAKSYLVAPNSTVQLWDSERQTIYLKSADASGMPSMKVLDYTIRETTQNSPQAAPQSQTDKLSTYATKAEIDGILAQIQGLKAEIDKMKGAEHEPDL